MASKRLEHDEGVVRPATGRIDVLEPIAAGRIFRSSEPESDGEVDDLSIPNDRLLIRGDSRRFAGSGKRLTDISVEARIERDNANRSNGAAIDGDLEKAAVSVASRAAMPGDDHVVARDSRSPRDRFLSSRDEFIELDASPQHRGPQSVARLARGRENRGRQIALRDPFVESRPQVGRPRAEPHVEAVAAVHTVEEHDEGHGGVGGDLFWNVGATARVLAREEVFFVVEGEVE
jgi:hypothetical protein